MYLVAKLKGSDNLRVCGKGSITLNMEPGKFALLILANKIREATR